MKPLLNPFLFLNRFLSFAACLLFSGGAIAQDRGSVSGVVTDGKLPVEFANVILFDHSDTSKAISVSVTDSLGNFSVTDLPLSSYILKIQLIGYEASRNEFTLDSNTTKIYFS
jgi:hypothetical protein